MIDAAASVVRKQWAGRPVAAIILGTGLGGLADEVEAEAVIPYRELPGFPHSTAPSHRSLLVCGRLEGRPVVVMNGRCHLYEGHSVDRLAFPVRVLARLGADALIVSNASGGVNPLYHGGDILVMDDHINLMGVAPRDPRVEDEGPGRHPSGRVYDRELIATALGIARRREFAAHAGVYVAVSGPNYETRAEYRAFRRIGGDVVGMSTVPEALAASQCGLRVLGLSLITNVARPDAPERVDSEDVVQVAARAAPHLLEIVREVVRGL